MSWKRFLSILVLVLPLTIHTGCSGILSTDSAKKAEGEKKAPPGPKDFQAAKSVDGMLREGAGKFAGDQYDQEKLYSQLDKFPKNLSGREVYNRLIYYLAEDYKPILKKVDEFNPTVPTDAKMPGTDVDKEGKVQNLNVEILLDSSGSMADRIGNRTRMDLAKSAIRDFVSTLPEGARVSLRVYGHKGSNSKKDKDLSCKSSELAYPLSPYDSTQFNQSLDSFKPGGWTPLATSIQAAQQDLQKEVNSETQNIVYVVSDGVETCGGDPVQAAKSLYESDIEAVVNIIGLDVEHSGQQSLKEVAEAGGGTYRNVRTQEDLKKELERRYRELRSEWRVYEQKLAWDMVWNGRDKIVEAREIMGTPDNIIVKKSLFWDTRKMEKEHLDDARKYLKEKEIIDSSTYSDLGSLIHQRNSMLNDYRADEMKRLHNEIDNFKKRMKDLSERRRQQAEDNIQEGLGED